MLVPKQLIDQANVITIDEKSAPEADDENQWETPPDNKRNENSSSMSDILKAAYSSQGNVVRCVTGSFD